LDDPNVIRQFEDVTASLPGSTTPKAVTFAMLGSQAVVVSAVALGTVTETTVVLVAAPLGSAASEIAASRTRHGQGQLRILTIIGRFAGFLERRNFARNRLPAGEKPPIGARRIAPFRA
jgi:hypothetical protein